MKALEVDIRQKIFPNHVCAIRKLAFSAEQGEFLALVGPSGAGKTTLLNIVAGLDRNVDGVVRINTAECGDAGNIPQRIGFMFQESRLLPWLTAIENVALVLRKHERHKARALLEKVGLAEFEHAYPGQLSGGMQRRVGLARAFAFEPQLLLMDEPFQSLDSPTADHLRNLLLDFWKHSSCSVLFVTHNLREALALADRILFFSSRPACVVNELNINLPRPRTLDGAEVDALYQRLHREHPRLLSGLASNPAAPPATEPYEWHESRIG